MKQLKKLSLTLALLITAATGAWAQGPWTSGDCTLTLNNGTLTVSGNGAMADYETEEKTWENSTSVVVESGVTSIGQNSFNMCSDLASVTLPEGLTAIGPYAFGNCSSLQSITIPSTVTSIGDYAFCCYTGSAMTDVYLYPDPANLTWGNTSMDFKENKATQCHVLAEHLSAYQTNFSSVNVTFVGDLQPLTPAGPVVDINDAKTTASFTMPANDVTVNYTLVRDMQDQANPVTFSGLPNTGNIIVKKGNDSKYQPAAALTIQLIDPVAAADAQNIIAATGLTVTVEKKGDGDTWTSGTLADFLADMQPGTYKLKAVPKDETSPYEGTVTSNEFTLVEQYDLLVEPADEYSKGKIESVTVGTEQPITPDASTGKATKTGIAPNTEVKIKAKRGYIIEKVEAQKTVQN